jgi:hypothetical protein
MNRLRCFLFAAIVVISSATLALGGEMQAPGKSATPTPTPTASAVTTESTTDGITAPTSTEVTQIAWQDLARTMLREILLAIY